VKERKDNDLSLPLEISAVRMSLSPIWEWYSLLLGTHTHTHTHTHTNAMKRHPIQCCWQECTALWFENIHQKWFLKCWWLIPVILATQEVEIRSIRVRRSQPRQTVLETLPQKSLSQKKAGGVAQGVSPKFKSQYHKKKKKSIKIKYTYLFFFSLWYWVLNSGPSLWATPPLSPILGEGFLR
jgi:hypothetical protein